MTLEEISSLVLNDVINQVKSRVFASLDPQPVFDEETGGEYETWFDSQFTQEQLDAEFLVYKQELIDTENERLRKEDLKTRFESLNDMRLAFHTLHPNTPNPAIWLKELLQKDAIEAEADMVALEAKDIELLPSQDEINMKKHIKDRDADLLSEGITRDILLEALVRKEFLNDPGLFNSIKPNIEGVNTRNPKP